MAEKVQKQLRKIEHCHTSLHRNDYTGLATLYFEESGQHLWRISVKFIERSSDCMPYNDESPLEDICNVRILADSSISVVRDCFFISYESILQVYQRDWQRMCLIHLLPGLHMQCFVCESLTKGAQSSDNFLHGHVAGGWPPFTKLLMSH